MQTSLKAKLPSHLEKGINGIPGIRSISSSSQVGSSNITVEFNLGIDLDDAANDVRDKVSQAQRNLPQDIDSPPSSEQKRSEQRLHHHLSRCKAAART
jgi:multidrug efflux pump subunit AcrB